MRKKEVNLKGVVDLKDAIAHLENLIACLKAGKVCFQNCEDHVALAPGQQVKLEVSASQREAKESFTIKLAWHKAESECESLKLRITEEEPPQEEPAKTDEPEVESDSVPPSR